MTSNKKIRVIVYRVGARASVEEIPATLQAKQKIVGGYIAGAVLEGMLREPSVKAYFNDEGLLLGLPFNREVEGNPVVGDFVIAGLDSDGDPRSLTRAEIRRHSHY